MRANPQNGNAPDPQILALMALGWLLQDDRRAHRLLDLTGLDVSSLREGADDPIMLAAVLAFLESHEPDLVACAHALGLPPETIVAARRMLLS
jgi:Protein of unknown function (DUF3572)